MGPGMPMAFRQLHRVNLSKSNKPHQICFECPVAVKKIMPPIRCESFHPQMASLVHIPAKSYFAALFSLHYPNSEKQQGTDKAMLLAGLSTSQSRVKSSNFKETKELCGFNNQLASSPNLLFWPLVAWRIFQRCSSLSEVSR